MPIYFMSFVEYAPPYIWALLIGCAVGLAELLSRYQWSIQAILRSREGWAYLLINGAASAFAYKTALDWGFGESLKDKGDFWRVLLVSISSMFILRSSFAQVRFANQDVGLGLVSILGVFLKRAERGLDQNVASMRWSKVDEICAKLSYSRTRDFFQDVVANILATQGDNETLIFQSIIKKIDDTPSEDPIKMRLFAMVLFEYLGDKLFEQTAKEASNRFAKDIKDEQANRENRLTQLESISAKLLNPKA